MTQDKNVRLYYLGGLGTPKRTGVTVRSRGRVISLPPAGEYLDVSELVANDLISRHKVIIPKEGTFDAFTRNPRIADAVKKASDIRAQAAGFQPNRQSLEEASDEAILTLARERGLLGAASIPSEGDVKRKLEGITATTSIEEAETPASASMIKKATKAQEPSKKKPGPKSKKPAVSETAARDSEPTGVMKATGNDTQNAANAVSENGSEGNTKESEEK